MRRGEIANAKCGQIRERINKDGEVIHLLSTLGKGGTTRSIPLAPDMMDALGHYMVLRGHGATRAGWAEDLPLVAHVRNFTVGKRDDDPDKCHLTSQSVYDAFKRAVGRAVAAMPEETPAGDRPRRLFGRGGADVAIPSSPRQDLGNSESCKRGIPSPTPERLTRRDSERTKW